MGALHEGHVALFRAAREECETVVVSLFVNPTQFGPNDDLSRYPRDEARDAEVAEAAGVDILFSPSVEEMYPDGYSHLGRRRGDRREGAARPGHFRGVATVCLKLFNIVRPQVAYFGQKDAQQVAVLRRMIRDLDSISTSASCRPSVTRTVWRCRRATPTSRTRRAQPRARAAAGARSRTFGARHRG